MIRKLFTIMVLLPISFGALCQSEHTIRVLARAHSDSIVVRWAPSTPQAWSLLNKYGYKVERYTIKRDNEILTEKPVVTIGPVIKPAAQQEWEKWIQQDDFVAICAQAIFGEEFQINHQSTDLMQIYQKTRELESRYSFALYASDLSVRAARLSGLGIVDKDVKPNEMYLYRVHSLAPATALAIDFGFFYTGPSEAGPLPEPYPPFVGSVNEVSVLLKWDSYTLRDTYIGYFLERSLDNGTTFMKTTDLPMAIMLNEDQGTYSSKSDSLLIATPIFYRVRGVNSFGEMGPPSDSVLVVNEKPLTSNPAISKITVLNNSTVKISWEFPEAAAGDIKGFDIERKTGTQDAFKTITKTPLSADRREFNDETPSSTNYYRVVAFTEKGQRTFSFPSLAQLEDSIPPLPPQGIKALIDSAGVVKLVWNNNEEPDLLGYRVFRSSFQSSEFGQVTVSPLAGTAFQDTVNIKTLTKAVYYKVAAVDNRFNASSFSDVVKVDLPDIIPPVPPVLTGFRSTDSGVLLQWKNSSSDDVAGHHIYRKGVRSTTWQLIKNVTASDSCCQYLDSSGGAEKYQYAMLAVDKSGLRSSMTKPVWGQALKKTGHDKVEDIRGSIDRTAKQIRLTWSYKKDQVLKFYIYRAIKDEPLTLYRSVNAPNKTFIDEQLRINTSYQYRIKAVFIDGSESAFSDAIEVNY